ncbi:MAG TPA: hypothetical protein VMR00_05700 [Streptosporangiaceae bacterium]|nr:hypothetical protein [Streptosporangiaceae bacterium]
MAATLTRFKAGELPEHLVWQSLSFMRCEWPSLFAGSGRLRSCPYPAIAHLTCTDGRVLLSYADIVSGEADTPSGRLSVLGLSNVFTFPPYRREGNASRIVRAANAFIDEHKPGIAILFCKQDLASFYSAMDWTPAPAGTITSPSDAALAMVRRTLTSGLELAAQLRRSPLTLSAAW